MIIRISISLLGVAYIDKSGATYYIPDPPHENEAMHLYYISQLVLLHNSNEKLTVPFGVSKFFCIHQSIEEV